ncbi:MAG: dockerin type I repeat-containing protein [Ruminococcus sp.]|nr:dockerin type I repeat-containing protein [Ruminococcus sp.]
MKKTLKKVTISLTAMLMMFGSTCTAVGSASATDDEIQSKGTWYVYGDVNNDGMISLIDLVSVNKAIQKFNELTGSSSLPLEYAVARPAVYFGSENYVPQAADIDGDGYITDNDSSLLLYYIAERYDEAGRCGQPFFIN